MFYAYAILTFDKVVLFVNGEQLDDGVRTHLGDDVEIQPYEAIFDYLRDLTRTLGLNAEKVYPPSRLPSTDPDLPLPAILTWP